MPPLADGAAPGTVAMVGNVGQRFWSEIQGAPEGKGPDPIDRWTARVLGGLADGVLFPFGGPPHHPFQRWARRADPSLSPSPLGILIHPEFGLWHALRGALLYRERLELPAAARPGQPLRRLHGQALPAHLPGRRVHAPRATTRSPAAPTCTRSRASPA